MSTQTTIFNESNIEISVDEYNHLKECEKQLYQIQNELGEILGVKKWVLIHDLTFHSLMMKWTSIYPIVLTVHIDMETVLMQVDAFWRI